MLNTFVDLVLLDPKQRGDTRLLVSRLPAPPLCPAPIHLGSVLIQDLGDHPGASHHITGCTASLRSSDVAVLTPESQTVILFGNTGVTDVISQDEVMLAWEDPDPMTGILTKRGNLDTHRKGEDHMGRDAVIHLRAGRIPRTTTKSQERGLEHILFLKEPTLQHLDLGLLAFRTTRKSGLSPQSGTW